MNNKEKTSRSIKIIFIILTFFSLTVCLVGLFLLLLIKGIIGEMSTEFADEPHRFDEILVRPGNDDKKIIIIDIHGLLLPSTNMKISLVEKVIQQLKQLKQDPTVVAIILDIDSPGGAVTSTDELYHELQKLRKDTHHPIPIISYMRHIAASGGYYLAAGTDRIIANRLTLTGSIGVIIGGYNYGELLKKYGVYPEIYKSGKLKDMLNMARSRGIEESEVIHGLIKEAYEVFVSIVAEGRRLPLESVKASPIGDARIMTGEQALKVKLIDRIGYLETAIGVAETLAKAKNSKVVRYQQTPSLLQQILSIKNAAESKLDINTILPLLSLKKGQLYYLYPLAVE